MGDPIYTGDLITSRLTALQFLSMSLYKLCVVYLIPRGSSTENRDDLKTFDGKIGQDKRPYGLLKATRCWKLQTVGNFFIWSNIWRFFYVAMETEGWDMQYVLMIVFFETFVLGVTAFL